ncbi:MAG: hypothetical protein GY725_07275 [bacterium]|nr:hypothetical protein [bacterium]
MRRKKSALSQIVLGAFRGIGLVIAMALVLPAGIAAGDDTRVEAEDDWDSEDEDEGRGRSFFYKELVLSGFYSREGVTMIPMDDMGEDHFELSHRPPHNYIGVDYVGTFTDSSPLRKLFPDWLPLTAVDFHPRLVFDRIEVDNGLRRIEFAPQDFWIRFNPGKIDRLSLRIGQFVIPYGVNPIQAPRQRFILPIEATDLGMKWDWGIDLKGPLGEYDWQIAATIGSGEAIHSSHLFSSSERESYLFSGRLGTPTYWDFQYGVSFAYGDLPTVRGPRLFSDNASISRWRLALDGFYKYGTYLMCGAQLTYGEDGFAGDEKHVMVTMGKQATVVGYRVWADWVVPNFQDIRLAAQFESVIRDTATKDADDTAAIIGVNYSLTTSVSLQLNYRKEYSNTMGMENDAFYFTFVYYSR